MFYFINGTLCLIIMALLMNVSTQFIITKSSGKNIDIIKGSARMLFVFISLSTFSALVTPLIIVSNPVFKYHFSLSLHLANILGNLLILYMPFVLLLVGRKSKEILITVPIYVEFASIIVAVQTISVLFPVFFLIIFFSKYRHIAEWNFKENEPVNIFSFVKSFLYGILAGVCITSWFGTGMMDLEPPLFSISIIIATLSLVVISVLFYLIPTIIATRKKHPQKIPIILVNILLGWSFIVWIVALVWACMNSTPKVLHIHEEAKEPDLAEKIRVLENLRKEGLITTEEFESKKSDLIKKY